MPPIMVVTDTPSERDQQFLLDRLVSFNDTVVGPSGYELVAALLKSDEGETIVGLWGKIAYDWLFIDLLFVPEELRGSGFGAQLTKAGEQIARKRGCVGIWLDTHGFQAPGFYKRQGYDLFGELPDYGPAERTGPSSGRALKRMEAV